MKESCIKKIKGEMDAMRIYIRTMKQKLAVIKQRKDIALFQTQRGKEEWINRKMNDMHMQHQIEYISCDNFGMALKNGGQNHSNNQASIKMPETQLTASSELSETTRNTIHVA
eukprot:12323498-Ditylum_brightwellii.AAC.1